jgi:hypothetical protein
MLNWWCITSPVGFKRLIWKKPETADANRISIPVFGETTDEKV